MLTGKPTGKRPLGRPRRRWEYNKELYELYKSSDIITDIKIARLRLARYVQRISKSEILKSTMNNNTQENRRKIGKLKLER